MHGSHTSKLKLISNKMISAVVYFDKNILRAIGTNRRDLAMVNAIRYWSTQMLIELVFLPHLLYFLIFSLPIIELSLGGFSYALVSPRMGKPLNAVTKAPLVLFLLLWQLRNLIWATSKHDVYLIQNYSVTHWSSLLRRGQEVLNVAKPILSTLVCCCLFVPAGFTVIFG